MTFFSRLKTVTTYLFTFYVVLYLVLMIFVFYTPFIEQFHESNNSQQYFEEDIGYYQTNLRNFLLGKESLADDGFYSQRELDHMKDVQFLFVLSKWIFFFAAVFLLFQKTEFTRKKIQVYSCTVIGGILFFSLAAWLLFPMLFELFHKVFFQNDLWLLPANSSLILLFPETFFFQTVLAISVLLLVIHTGVLLFFKIRTTFTRK